MIKSRRMRWAGFVALVGRRGMRRDFGGKARRKDPEVGGRIIS
jgi:hypothetical protein